MKRNWFKLWSGIAGIALVVALVLTFIPVGPTITIGGTLSIGVNYPNQNVALKIGDEVVNLRTETSKTYYLGNDTYEARIYTTSADPNDPWYYSSASDGDFPKSGTVYASVWNATTCTPDAITSINVGQLYINPTYAVYRAFLFFDTSSIPVGGAITAAALNLYGNGDSSAIDFLITIQTGGSIYPHDPAVAGDYDKSYYSGDGGSLTTVGWNGAGYNTINLNADGMSWITKAGQTKFLLRSSRDIAGTTPTGAELENIFASEASGTSKDPYLAVTYTPLPWLTGYTYRQEFTIAGTADGAQTNYTMPCTVNKTGTGSTGSTVCLNSRCLSWAGTVPNDMRFTKLDGTTELDYWIESSDANTAQVWVEFDSIPIEPNNASFYIYYGKASDITTSNGTNTFIRFDSFEWGSDGDPLSNDGGGLDWTAVLGTPDIDNATAYGGTRSGRFYHNGALAEQASFPQTAGTTYAIRFRHRRDTVPVEYFIHGNGAKAILMWSDATETIGYYDTDYRDTGYDFAVNTWELLELNDINFFAGTYDIWFKGQKIKDNAGMQARAAQANVFEVDNNAGTSEVWCDDVIVRRWVATEPTWGTWGPEEGGPAITNSQSAWAIGSVEVNDTRYFSATGLQDNDYVTVTNTGTCTVDVAIQGLDIEGGSYDWGLASSAGNQTYSLYANSGNGSSTYNIEVKKSSYSNLCSALAVNATYVWSMKFIAPTIFNVNDDGAQKTTTVTLVATAS